MFKSIFTSFLILCIGLALSNLAQAGAADYITERSYFEDKSASMSFDEVQRQPFTPMGQVLSKGYSNSIFWLKLKIVGTESKPALNQEVGSDLNQKLVLRIQPTYLNFIRLYDPLESTIKPRIVGDKYPLSANEYQSLNFNFVIPKAQQSRYVWLQMSTTSTNFMHVQALDIQETIRQDKLQEMFLAFYMGVLFLLLFLPLVIWFLKKEWLTGVFVMKQFGALLLTFFYAGYFRFIFKDISPSALDLAFNINVLLYSLITITFHYVFLYEYKLKLWAKCYFFVAAVCFPLELFLLLSGHDMYALRLNMHVLNGFTMACLLIPFVGVPWNEIVEPIFNKRQLILIHFIMLIFGTMTILPSLGYLQGNPFSPMAGMMYGGVTGVIFLFVLQYRYRVTRDKNIAELSSAKAYAKAEKTRREDQEKFLAMLTHELKTPLSVLKMSYTSNSNPSEKTKAHVQTAIADMNDVIDRCAMADKFENRRFELETESCDLNRMVKNKLATYQLDERFELIEKDKITLTTDPKLLRICLDNLISNALKYGNNSEKITLVLSNHTPNKKAFAAISVSNVVGPVGKPDPEKVFEKYYRAPKAYEKTGSGLGLYLVKSLIELMGGNLSYSSTKNTVTFLITLPKQKMK